MARLIRQMKRMLVSSLPPFCLVTQRETFLFTQDNNNSSDYFDTIYCCCCYTCTNTTIVCQWLEAAPSNWSTNLKCNGIRQSFGTVGTRAWSSTTFLSLLRSRQSIQLCRYDDDALRSERLPIYTERRLCTLHYYSILHDNFQNNVTRNL